MGGSKFLCAALLAIGLGFVTCSTGLAGVTKTGSISDGGTSSSDIKVGYLGVGALSIDASSTFTRYNGYLGYYPGYTGTATVSGTGSTWTNSGNFYVGYNGSGILKVQAGGQVVNSSSGYIGYNAGSTGTATVTGAGSQWANSSYLYVGNSGSGKLTVSDGGLVIAGTLLASLSDLSGNGTITVSKGAVLDADMIFDGTHGLTQAMTFGSSGTLNLTIDPSGTLGAGYKGTGTLRVAEGLTVASGDGYLGYNSASMGTATITGAGSKWSNSGTQYIGYSGSGTLNVQSGGQVSNSIGYLGYNSGSTGTATITGASSTWNSSSLNVGYYGSGTLNIGDGGKVSSGSCDLGLQAGSTGTATVNGTGSTWTNIGSIYVGKSGVGTMNVQAGGQVSSGGCIIGYYSGSTGTVNVTGAGSTWTNTSDLNIGYLGNGKLTVSDGGTVTAVTLWASLSNLSGNGTITVSKGAVLDADMVFDVTHGTTTTIPFGSGGTLSVTAAGGLLGIGYRGTGTLRIADGVTVASTTGYLGYKTGSNGTATVTGNGSKWSSGNLYVGNSGSGTLNVEAGGQVSNSTGYLGYGSGTTGTATVTGNGSTWTNSGSLYIGNYDSSGILNVQAGGQVSSATGYIGYDSGSTGTATVTGTGTMWTNDGVLVVGAGDYASGKLTVSDGGLVTTGTLLASWSDLSGNGTITASQGAVLDIALLFDATHGLTQAFPFGSGGTLNLTVAAGGGLGVGYKGTGTLRIADGVAVSSSSGFIGYKPGSAGTATVTGAGSTWTNSSTLYVGFNGSGKLTVADGGRVAAAILNINSPAVVRLNVCGNDMLVLGSMATAGKIYNYSTVNLYANAFLNNGTYTPISDSTGRQISWVGNGSYRAVGGTWTAAHTFTVPAATQAKAGDLNQLTTGQRFVVTDAATGRQAGASFGSVTGSPTFSAAPMSADETNALTGTQGFAGTLLSGWDFSTTNYSGGEVLLAFNVGTGADDVAVWHYSSGAWSQYTADDMLTYDSQGIVSFIATDMGSYAVAAVPEPASLAMLAIGGLALLRRRRIASRDSRTLLRPA